jgi:hypothetical protein
MYFSQKRELIIDARKVSNKNNDHHILPLIAPVPSQSTNEALSSVIF